MRGAVDGYQRAAEDIRAALDDEHTAIGVAGHPEGHAAEQEPGNRAQSAGAEHYEIRPPLLGQAQNRLARITFGNLDISPDKPVGEGGVGRLGRLPCGLAQRGFELPHRRDVER